jgi:ABC-type oligopeptide transport system substrate-binding subunit
VFWPRDEDGVYGWVPAGELDGEPNRDAPVTIHADHTDGRPAVAARGGQLEATTDVLGIDVPDPYTITFRLNDPTPYFMLITDNRALRTSPIQAVSRWPRRWERPEHAVTSGPMTLTAWREHDVVELARSPVYWDQGAIGVDRISAYSIDDQAASTNIYFTGGCDATAANTIPSTYLPALDGEQTGHAYKDYSVQPFLGVYFAWVNTHRLSNRHLRRALSFAIDRTQIPRFTHGGEIPSAQLTGGTPIAQLSPADLALCGVAHDTPGVALVEVPGQLCYVPPPGLDYDPAAARRELALAKQELGAAFPSTIDYRYNAGSEAHKQIAEYLQSEWAAIGLHVEIDSQEFNSLLQDTKQGDYDLARLGVIASVVDAESEFLSLFKCGNPDNRGQYCSPAFERLMAEARVMGDRKARNAKLREAEAQMIGDVPVIPLYVYTQKHLIEPYVHDYAINLIDQPPLWRVRIEATK